MRIPSIRVVPTILCGSIRFLLLAKVAAGATRLASRDSVYFYVFTLQYSHVYDDDPFVPACLAFYYHRFTWTAFLTVSSSTNQKESPC